MATKKVTAKAATKTPAKSAKKATSSTASANKAPARKATALKAPAVKPPAKRAVPKVSPLAGTSVEAYAAKFADWRGTAIRAIAALVARVAPESRAVIKWSQPVFELGGPFAYAKAAGKHLTFGFWRGGELADPKGLLEGSGDRMRHVKLASADDVARLPLEAFVRQAAKLNAEKGDPTKR